MAVGWVDVWDMVGMELAGVGLYMEYNNDPRLCFYIKHYVQAY